MTCDLPYLLPSLAAPAAPGLSESVYVALIVGGFAFAGSIGLAWLNARVAAAKEGRDYARQDAVADRAAEAASQVASAAALLVSSNATVASAAESNARLLGGKLDVVHALVNSNMTTAKQDQLDANTTTLAVMQELLDLKRTAGKEPSAGAVLAIRLMEAKVTALAKELADRHLQQSQVDATATVDAMQERIAVATEQVAAETAKVANAAQKNSHG